MQFVWQCQPQAEALIERIIDECSKQNHEIAQLGKSLFQETSSRLLDWVDYVVVGNQPLFLEEIEKSGFTQQQSSLHYRVFVHEGAQLPRIVVDERFEQAVVGVAVAVDSITDFLSVRGVSHFIEGAPYATFRRCEISVQNEVALWVIERRGVITLEPNYPSPSYLSEYWEAVEMWKSRPRHLKDEDENMEVTLELASELVSSLGCDLSASIVLECERSYWQARNKAGQFQKNRQDHLGMGWANHDHHTFRSSRRHFAKLVRLFELLGFHCRERFYAGQEAGWGAQVMENPRGKFVLFLDVDLSPEELKIDFAHQALPELDHLGTIGLWCGLHGDSILGGGMHHLEAQFLFSELKADLGDLGVEMMAPFSDFPFLKQAFTKGERWSVEPTRLQTLLEKKLITAEQAEQFLKQGAIGSHLENLQRREGYKGFNQKNVSTIINETDPRRH